MAFPTATVRCPTCGTDLRLVLAPSPPTQWFPCPHCGTPFPGVVPRDPPPLYSWEVLPGLYPPLPPPRIPRWRIRPAVAIALAVVAVSAVGLGVVLGDYGFQAAAPASYTVSGSVDREVAGGGVRAAAGALVVLSGEANRTWTTNVSAQGTFFFPGIPAGGISLAISLAGYAPVTVDTFVSPVYDAGVTGLSVLLVPGSAANATTQVLSPFPDLESFLASLGGAAALMGIVAGVAGFAAIATVRDDRRPLGVVGGGAGVAAPAAIYLLGLGPIFPLVVLGAAIAGGFGAFVVTLRAVELARTAPIPGPD